MSPLSSSIKRVLFFHVSGQDRVVRFPVIDFRDPETQGPASRIPGQESERLENEGFHKSFSKGLTLHLSLYMIETLILWQVCFNGGCSWMKRT